MTLPVDQFVPNDESRVCRYMGVGTQWDCDASAFEAVTNTITREGITHFSEWADRQEESRQRFGPDAVHGHGGSASDIARHAGHPRIVAVTRWLVARAAPQVASDRGG